MKLHLISDLHMDAYLNREDYVIYDLDPGDCGALIVAGDLSES